ncbi:MAG TPA: molybdate ABC transporter substrate-binding protein [Prolixibacteraceae bacterium]|nr:molybdate ABC transporter substrate-binding protein [Prolixibacteraceae bacterium]HCR92043.1 molybdate ABC transporter substrate-binding protein [Prolixibacteraceae bacterium]HCU59576.1 molybdate ABC transporter substrate-binding protein [Prolixibacteraceae bacterium]
MQDLPLRKINARLKTGILILLVMLLFSCSGKKKQGEVPELFVFAAASLSDVISEIADSFKVDKNVEIKLNVAASGTLARQIEQGAGADVFLSADENWKNYLAEKKLVRETAVFAANDLVLIAPPGDTTKVSDVVSLLKETGKKIAIGDPGYVPAGKYAMQVVDFYHLDLSSKLFQTVDVRSALMMVEMGEAGYGIVYKTDAIQSAKVNAVCAFPEEAHQPISYFRVLISGKPLAKDFYDYLYSPKAKAILAKYQFKAD